MWADQLGGWTYELSALAGEYARCSEHYLASLAYGIAKFPVLAIEARRRALRRQVEEYRPAIGRLHRYSPAAHRSLRASPRHHRAQRP
jgi:hypothetical protein